MLKLIKWIFGLVLLLVVLIVAAAVILPFVIDPNDFKPQIVDAAKKRLGRDLGIEQDLNLSVFPWVGIETGGVRLGNAPGFAERPFAEVAELGLKVKLMPLLDRRIEVDTLVVKGLTLHLEKDASGRTNWDDLAEAAATDAPPAGEPAAPADAPTAETGTGMTFHVSGVQVEDANVVWDDRQAGQYYELRGVRLATGAIEPGATVPVEAGMAFTSRAPAMTLTATLDAQVSSDTALQVFRVDGLDLALDAEGEGLPAGGSQLTLSTDAVLDLGAGTLGLAQLKITGPALSATGEVDVSGLQAQPAATGRLAVAETNPKELASMFAAPIATTDDTALTRASGDLTFAYADGVLKLEPLALRLDDSMLEGHVHLLDMAGPTVRTELTLDRIDLDRYMPPVAAEPPPDSTPPATGADAKPGAEPAAAADPFAPLRGLDLDGRFTVGELIVNKLRMRNVSTRVVSKAGVLRLDPMGADLYQGRFKGTTELNASGKVPRVEARHSLAGIQIGPLLQDLAGQDRMTGLGEVELDLRLAGLSEAEIRRSLNGTSRFSFRDGALKGVNIAQVIREASAALGLRSEGFDTGTPGQTDFTELGGSFTITDGVIRNRDLSAKSPLLRITGEGEVDLPRDTVDYLVTTTLVSTLAGQGGKARDDLAGVAIPVRVSGPLADPTFRPDLEKVLTEKAKDQLEQKAREEIERKLLKDQKVPKEVEGLLRGLFD